MTTRPASPEAFRTYGNYLRAWKLVFQQLGVADVSFGADPTNPTALTTGTSSVIADCLHRYWGNLRALEILNSSGIAAEVLMAHPPIAYYTVHNASRAFLFARNIQAADSHGGVLKQMAQRCEHNHLPVPWSAYCEGDPADQAVRRLGQIQWPASNLQAVGQGNAVGFVALSLKTTRSHEVDAEVDKQKGNRKKARRGTRKKVEQSLRVTTVFDMFYRYRREAHYGKPDNFAAFDTEAEGNEFGADLLDVVDTTTGMLEARIHERVGTAQMREWYEGYMDQHQINQGEGPVGRRYTSLIS